MEAPSQMEERRTAKLESRVRTYNLYVILYQYYMLHSEAVQRVLLQCVAAVLIPIDWIRYNSNAVLYREHSRGFHRVVLKAPLQTAGNGTLHTSPLILYAHT